MVVCIRGGGGDAQFQTHEDFIGLHHVANITFATTVGLLKDTVLHLNLSLSMCHAQCNDGASNMEKVASEIKAIEPTTLYLHCFAHSSYLAVADTLKSIKLMSDTVDHCLEICKLIKPCPRKDASFSKLKEEMAPVGPGLPNL